MVHSMTGFGRGRATVDGTTADVELRSVNKRHHDVSLRIPDALADREGDIQTRLTEAFERGRFLVDIEVAADEEEALPIDLDTEKALAYKKLLERLSSAAQIQEPIRLEHLMQFDDLFVASEEARDVAADEMWPAVEAALNEAIDALRSMRAQEGKALRTDLAARIDAIEENLDAIEDRAPERVRERQERLQERLDELVADDRIDPDRLETEIALLADKLDVTEECVRLRSHLEMFREAMDADEPAGRKLKFITQEIHRESNTIGAKANDETISRCAVEIKEEIEKIREQISNVE
jgi:uncharacterized protein (TIGR00255 family)